MKSEPVQPVKRSCKPWRCRLWTTARILLVVYLLGIGPAARLDARGIIPPFIYETFYWPLVSFAGSSFGQTLGFLRFLDWYVMDVWKPYPDAPAPSDIATQ